MLFRLLENSADPFRPHDRGTPPATARRFLTGEFRPLRLIVVLALATTVAGAAIEVWLIGYAGRLVEGRIAEQGTHESLLALGGLYAALWSRQSGGFL